MKERYKILIVEDEVLIAQSLMMDIEEAGYDVYDFLTTGEEAINFTEEVKPDIILMDINLAGKIDGIEAAEEINKKLNIPIIFTTGYTDQNNLVRAKKIKPISILKKPIEIWELKPIIETILRKEQNA